MYTYTDLLSIDKLSQIIYLQFFTGKFSLMLGPVLRYKIFVTPRASYLPVTVWLEGNEVLKSLPPLVVS